jgi:hypothetical protein
MSVARFLPVLSTPQAQARSMQTLIPNTVTTLGIATLPGYDAAIPVTLPQLWVAGRKAGQEVLRLLGIEYAILPIDDPRDKVEHRVGIEPMFDPLPGARLYRVPGALPRVYLAGRAEIVPDGDVRQHLFEPGVIDGSFVFLAPGAGVEPLDAPAGRAGVCRVTAFANSRVAADCKADRDAIAVFIEQYDTGWNVEVDGRPAPLLRANLLVRGVAIRKGNHTIILSYSPPGLRGGAALSLLSLLAIALLAGPSWARLRSWQFRTRAKIAS